MFVIMENLKSFLTSPGFVNHAGGPTYPNPVFAGAWVHPYWMKKEGCSDDFYYMGGGAGYVLSQSAVRALVETVLPVCHSRKVRSAEDVLIADCQQRYLNVTGYDARDEKEESRFFDNDVGPRADVKAMTVPIRGQRADDRVYGATFADKTTGFSGNTPGRQSTESTVSPLRPFPFTRSNRPSR